MLTPEIGTVAVLRNVITAIASTLRPGAMLAVPLLSTTLLPCAMRLPAALLLPAPLLLPRDCLLPRALLLLSLLDPLLLLRLLSGLSMPLLLLVLLLLSVHLLLLWPSLRVLLLCRRRSFLVLVLTLFRLALFFALLVALSVRWDNRPQKQKQGGATGSSYKLHRNRPLLRSLLELHADDQSVSMMFQRLSCLRLGSGLVHRSVRVVGRRVERVQL